MSRRKYYSVSRKQTVPHPSGYSCPKYSIPIIKLTQITIQVTTEAAANIYIHGHNICSTCKADLDNSVWGCRSDNDLDAPRLLGESI